MKKHTFAICAYKESPYLEECIESLKRQTIPSDIIVVTSTPSEYIQNIAEKYKLPYYINKGEKGITQDWNFAYSCAHSRYITITHQDDIYEKSYLEHALLALERSRKPLIFFSDYYELRDGERVKNNMLLNIKRIMLLPLRIKLFQHSRWVRRRILSIGSPICCPSVTSSGSYFCTSFPLLRGLGGMGEDIKIKGRFFILSGASCGSSDT